MSAATAPKKDGKGYRYPVAGHLKKLDNSSGITRRTLLGIIGLQKIPKIKNANVYLTVTTIKKDLQKKLGCGIIF